MVASSLIAPPTYQVPVRQRIIRDATLPSERKEMRRSSNDLNKQGERNKKKSSPAPHSGGFFGFARHSIENTRFIDTVHCSCIHYSL
jgi:hypothetical protein